ncbi:MAG: membrane-fusion protein, partial [Alphaproteobacteria bacterium]|nr:membrane-fusion protein [Alphaproteobacteria bacterium]
DRIDHAAARTLTEPALASTQGGPIPARAGPQGVAIPERALYRLHCLVEPGIAPAAAMLTGTALIEAGRQSPAARLWRWVAAVLMREAGM